MRPFLNIVLIVFYMPVLASGQTVKTKNYKVVWGNYVFLTQTTFETDTLNNIPPREYLYFFKNERQVIKISRRIDTIAVFDISDPSLKRIEIDTVDQIKVNKIVDTISKAQLKEMINSEIKIYRGGDKLKFDEAHLETLQASGKTSYTIDLQRTKIIDSKHALESASGLDQGGYLILQTLWFYDLKKDRHEIECNIAWFIK